MKKLLILLFSFFLLSSPSVFADDISDFSIEGISIGDSLLDYMTEEEILEEIELNKDDYYYLNEPNKYLGIYLWKNFPVYDTVSVFIRNNSANKYLVNKNLKHTILSVRGIIEFINDNNSCMNQRDEIVEIVSEIFPNAQKNVSSFKYKADFSGNSIMNAVYFYFDSKDLIEVSCTDMDETFRIKKNFTEGLSVVVRPNEIRSWLLDE